MSHWPTHCERCGADLAKVSSIMSKFNQDTICSPCKARERAHPGYREADEAEIAAVRAGDCNFPGVGCPPVLYNPPCIAEQVAIVLEGQEPNPTVQIALCQRQSCLKRQAAGDEMGHKATSPRQAQIIFQR